MSDISQHDYIENIETKSKVLANYFSDELKRAEESNNFSLVKHRLPLMLDVISAYDDFSNEYHSETCSEFIGMVARIQKGLGMNEEYKKSLSALNQYQKGVEFQDTSLFANPDTNPESNLNPSMY